MPYYLDSYLGTGVRGNEFRPSSYDDDPASVGIDLRPDGSKAAGFALVNCPSVLKGKAGRTKIGDDKLTKSAGLVTVVQSRLGLNLADASMSIADVASELLVVHGRVDGTRWRPLVPSLFSGAKQLEIWLGDLLWSQPVISGGAVGTESFNKANSTTLGPDLTWTETVGDFEVLSNQLHLVTNAGSNNYARCEFDTGASDMYSQVKIIDTSTYSEMYILARYAAAAQTFYYAVIYQDGGTGNWTIRKNIAGSDSRIGSNIIQLPSANDVIRIECSGSTIRNYRNGTLSQTITDTSIATNTRGGLGGYRESGGDFHMDLFETGSLTTAQLEQIRIAGAIANKPKLIRIGGVFVSKPAQVRVGGVMQDIL